MAKLEEYPNLRLSKEKLEPLKKGIFIVFKPNFTRRTAGALKGKHISSDKVLREYETSGGRH